MDQWEPSGDRSLSQNNQQSVLILCWCKEDPDGLYLRPPVTSSPPGLHVCARKWLSKHSVLLKWRFTTNGNSSNPETRKPPFVLEEPKSVSWKKAPAFCAGAPGFDLGRAVCYNSYSYLVFNTIVVKARSGVPWDNATYTVPDPQVNAVS